MPQFFIRSTIFNVLFYILTGISCIILLPTLILPRRIFLGVVTGFCHTTAYLEKYILGLTYEVRGRENIPQSGSYIIAAKHQSAYETLKLHLLFNDPAIVLKKELFKIPLWGWYLRKSDVIAIDRSSPKLAIKSIQDGARHVTSQGRPIVIFPQGTRVMVGITPKEKPYKIGIVRIEQATNIPIIPMALNTGVFQPRQRWCKNPGKVVFEFLPAITISSNTSETIKQIEMNVEQKSNALIEEGIKSIPKRPKATKIFGTCILLLCAAYTVIWFGAAHFTKKSITNFLNDIAKNSAVTEFQITQPKVTGFPGKMHLSLPAQTLITNAHEEITIGFIHAQSWPVMGMPIDIQTGTIGIAQPHWAEPLSFDSLNAQITYKNDTLTIRHATITAEKTKGIVSGTVDSSTPPNPVINLELGIDNFRPFLTELIKRKIVKAKAAMFVGVALTALEKNGIVQTTLTSDNDKLYLGPIRIANLPTIKDK